MIRPPDPGELRQVLVYQDAVETLDATGSPVETIVDRFAVRAKVDPLSGREAYQAAQAQSNATHDVTLRHRPGVSAGGRFAFRDQPGRVLQIESVRNLEERSTWLVCRCIEGKPDMADVLRTFDFPTFRVEIVPGEISVKFAFDSRVVASVADPRTGAILYDTGPEGILLSRWIEEVANRFDLAPLVEALLRTAVLRAAGVIE